MSNLTTNVTNSARRSVSLEFDQSVCWKGITLWFCFKSCACLFRRMLFALVEKVAIYGHDPDPNPQMMTNGWLHVEPVMPIWIPHLLQENRLERLQIKHSSLAQGLDYRRKISCQQKDLVPVDSVRSSNRAGTHWSIQRISLPLLPMAKGPISSSHA